VAMVIYGLFISKEFCVVNSFRGIFNRLIERKTWVVAVTLGFLTGINFCPPFLLAFSSSAHTNNLFQSILFFFLFFLGTSLFFLPTIFLGLLSFFSKLKTIGKMTAVVMSVYFFYRGIIMITGGIVIL